LLSLFDPACEVIFRPDVPEPGPFRGRTELLHWTEGFRSAWETHRSEVVHAEPAGDHVFVLMRSIGLAAGSGIETDDTWPFVFTIRGGQIARWQGFVETDEARRAARLAE
jgi:ketosteroid isomerase-like protein